MNVILIGTLLAGLLAAVWLPPQMGQLLFFALLGFFAGGIRAAQRSSPRPPLPDALRDVLAKASGGALSSFAAGAICLQYWGPDRLYVELVVAVLAGWLGTVLIDSVAGFVMARIETKLSQTPGAANPAAPAPKKETPP